MNSELTRQEKVLDAVTDHTDRSAYELQNVSQQAKKDFKVRPGTSSLSSTNPGNACHAFDWHSLMYSCKFSGSTQELDLHVF